MNLFFFGGAFDPPHIVHKKIITYFVERSEKLLIVPSYKSPLKEIQPLVSFEHRKNMLEIMLSNYHQGNISILDYENVNKFVYTCDSIKYLKNLYKNDQIHMIIGLDQYNEFHLWKDYKYLINNVNLVVISRPGVKISNKKYINHYIDDIFLDVSSTNIKKKILNSQIDTNMIDANVLNYIKKNRLYKS